MIDLHTWSTPNGRKASVMLEECGLPYRVFPVNIGKGEQFRPAFLADEYSIADIATFPWVARGMAVPTPPQ
jgi:glutathione S-transferase